jgi:cyclic pyranopterin phosphate synthase
MRGAEKKGFSHLDETGKARMVDVSSKPKVRRTARAAGTIFLSKDTLNRIRKNLIEKGDVLATARIAAIAAAKRTTELIPLCHNIAIDWLDVQFELQQESIDISSTAVCTDKTGIEMEALTAVSVAALTIYDMCKAVDSGMKIGEIRLLEKTREAVEEQGDA